MARRPRRPLLLSLPALAFAGLAAGLRPAEAGVVLDCGFAGSVPDELIDSGEVLEVAFAQPATSRATSS
jgi:hypothetical protein